mgnify:CR=1 FL=1
MEAQFEALSELVKNGQKLNFGQDFFVKFYQAFLYSDRWQQYIKGVGTTLLVTAIALVLGVVLGAIVAMVRVGYAQQKPHHRNPILGIFNAVAQVYVTVIRGTPMMVQAMVIYWGYAFAMQGQTLPLIPSGIMIVSVNTGAYMAEIVRGGIISIDKGHFEGASSIGMKHSQTMFKVVIPQVMRNILPSVSNEFVINIKDTSVLNVIGVTELYSIAGVIKRTNFQTFQTYFVVCVLYFILTFTITRLLRFAEKKLDGKDNYTIFGSQTDVDAEIHIKKEAE